MAASVVAEEWVAHGGPTPLLGSSVLAGTALLASGDVHAQASGCPPCRSNSPAFAELRTEQGQGHRRGWHTRWVEVPDA